MASVCSEGVNGRAYRKGYDRVNGMKVSSNFVKKKVSSNFLYYCCFRKVTVPNFQYRVVLVLLQIKSRLDCNSKAEIDLQLIYLWALPKTTKSTRNWSSSQKKTFLSTIQLIMCDVDGVLGIAGHS